MTRRTVVEREAERVMANGLPAGAEVEEAMRRVERAVLARVRKALRNLAASESARADRYDCHGLEGETGCSAGKSERCRDNAALLLAAARACCRPEKRR